MGFNLIVLQLSKRRWLYVTILVFAMLVLSQLTYALPEFGGWMSNKNIQRTGVGSSVFMIGTSGGKSPTDIALGPRVSTLAATNVDMITGTQATLNGNVSSLNGFETAEVWFEWGYDTSYGNSTAVQTVLATGNVSADIAHFDPTRMVYYRIAGRADGTVYGSSQTFQVSGLSGAYRIAQSTVFVWVAICALVMVGLYFMGMPLIYVVLIGVVVGLLGLVGAQALLGALQSLW